MTNNQDSHFGEKRTALLAHAALCWNELDEYRRRRERCKRYTYGDQWKDRIRVDGRWTTEEEYIRQQGNEPLKNNLIRRLVKNVIGLYRQQMPALECVARDPDEQPLATTMTRVLQCNWQLNRATEMQARAFEEFLISGMVAQRKSFGYRQGRFDCWTDQVAPSRFFFDRHARDSRGWDTDTIGQITDMSFAQLCTLFARSPQHYSWLAAAYQPSLMQARTDDMLTSMPLSQLSRNFLAAPHDRCRVLEVWQRVQKPRFLCHDMREGRLIRCSPEEYYRLLAPIRQQRSVNGLPGIKAYWGFDEWWEFTYLTPWGDVLANGISPFQHGQHPFVFKAYPFIDGEIHSFVDDVIDQQRYTNRLITLYDWVMRSSAKGVLMVPEDCIPDGMTLNDFAEEWARCNGVMAVRTRNGTPMPQQMAVNATNIGIHDLLQTQLDLFEDISGVSGVLQGKRGASVSSGTLFKQQTHNATTSLADIIDTFVAFLTDGAYKDLDNIRQCYGQREMTSIAGGVADRVVYDPEQMHELEFDLIVRPHAQRDDDTSPTS